MSNHTKFEEEEEEEEESYDEDFERAKTFLFDIKDAHMQFFNIKKYKMGKCIGINGLSSFYKIKNKANNDEFIAKICIAAERTLFDDDSKVFKSLKNDIEFSSRLWHPSIVKFVGYSLKSFKNRYQPIFILSNDSKCLFHDFLRKQKGEPDPQWNSTKKLLSIYSIASAMKYLHSLNIVHRNLNPNSMLIDKNLNPKICDFDLAIKIPFDNNQDPDVVGTPAYIAPEIWTSSLYSKSSDVYAFGFLVYEILSNNSPFQGMDSYQIMYRISFNKSRPHFNDKVSPAFKNLIKKCWAENPDHRPTFDEILKELSCNEEFISDDVDRNIYHQLINNLNNY